jgi:hypothetical protein
MGRQEGGRTYSYVVDNCDVIVWVGENWPSFAASNGGGETCSPQRIIGTSLWKHIYGRETQHFYEMILERVRRSYSSTTFPFRCDSPTERRFFTLSIMPMEHGSIYFQSRVIKTEARLAVELLQAATARSETFVALCIMCKKVAVSENVWAEIEVAVETIEVFQKHPMPQFTHGMCPSCFVAYKAELNKA